MLLKRCSRPPENVFALRAQDNLVVLIKGLTRPPYVKACLWFSSKRNAVIDPIDLLGGKSFSARVY